jgi:hypothetical protein
LRFVLFLEQVVIGDDGQVHIVSTRVVFYNEDIHYTGNTIVLGGHVFDKSRQNDEVL